MCYNHPNIVVALHLDHVWVVVEHECVVLAAVHQVLPLPQLVLAASSHLVIRHLQM